MPGINSTQPSSLRQTSSPSLCLSLRSLQIEGSRWKIGDDVAVSYSGDMYEVKYSDGSKSVVGEDKVKDIVK